MIVWTHTVLGVLYACVSYFCICTCSAQLSMFHMERCSRNTIITSIIIIIRSKTATAILSQVMIVLPSHGLNMTGKVVLPSHGLNMTGKVFSHHMG